MVHNNTQMGIRVRRARLQLTRDKPSTYVCGVTRPQYHAVCSDALLKPWVASVNPSPLSPPSSQGCVGWTKTRGAVSKFSPLSSLPLFVPILFSFPLFPVAPYPSKYTTCNSTCKPRSYYYNRYVPYQNDGTIPQLTYFAFGDDDSPSHPHLDVLNLAIDPMNQG